jgi:hypothetical protein
MTEELLKAKPNHHRRAVASGHSSSSGFSLDVGCSLCLPNYLKRGRRCQDFELIGGPQKALQLHVNDAKLRSAGLSADGLEITAVLRDRPGPRWCLLGRPY